jgi:hypothetical protein
MSRTTLLVDLDGTLTDNFTGISRSIRHAFVDLGLHRLEANVQPANLRSLALAERAGFVREGYSRRYLRFAGVVGQPHVRGFHVRFSGRIRSGPEAPWMPFTGEQHSFTDPPSRFFWMRATRAGLPVDGLHAYGEEGASMRVRLLSLFPVAGASGPGFTRTETVTLLNDMCIMAPAALLDAAIRCALSDG